jgi:hypothetical protein
MLQVSDVLAGGSEDFNEAIAITGHVIVLVSILLSVGYEQAPANILNVKGGEPVGDTLRIAVVAVVIAVAFGIERVRPEVGRLEVRVVHLDAAAAEIGYVEEPFALDVCGGATFVDGAIRRSVIVVVHDADGVGSAIPARDGPVFRDKDKRRPFAVWKNEVSAAAVENRPGRS